VATVFQQWNPTQTNSQISLSNGSLTAAMSGATNYVKTFGLNSVTSGKYYFEIIVNFSSFACVGLGNTSSTTSGILGAALNELGWQINGSVSNNAVVIGTWLSYTSGQTLRIAFDLTLNSIWGAVGIGPWNNSINANPVTGIGGLPIPSGVFAVPVVPSVLLYQSTLPDHHVAYFSASNWSYTAPIGFNSMDKVSTLSWQNAGSAITGPPLSVPVTGLSPLTNYDFQVVANNIWGQTPSTTLNVTTTA
jgi:hypothetical protein